MRTRITTGGSPLIAVVIILLVAAVPLGAATAPTALVSHVSNGPRADGDSFVPDISADGRFVVFRSHAANLPGGDGSTWRIYRHDTATGNTALVSRTSAGPKADGNSFRAAISANGRFVAFYSQAANLPGGDGSTFQVYRHDTATGSTALVSRTTGGTKADDDSFNPSISADGRFVAFDSRASNLPGGDGVISQIYRRDIATGSTALVSQVSNGPRASGPSFRPAISASGRFVAFESRAANLPGGDGATFLIYVHDRGTGNTALVSRNSSGTKADATSIDASISASGRFVAFHSFASNLPGGGGMALAYVHDRQSGDTALVSRTSAGPKADGDGFAASISDDGRFVAFSSVSSNLPGGNGMTTHTYRHDRDTGNTALVSRLSNGGPAADGHTFEPSISGDGRFIAFSSEADNLPGGDGSTRQIYRHGPR